MKVNDTIRVEPIFDYKHGRRMQVLIVNKDEKLFTTHHDAMGREYVKIKMTEADIFTLIQELNRQLMATQNKVEVLEAEFKRARLKLVESEKEE
jgi:hypothetical protein